MKTKFAVALYDDIGRMRIRMKEDIFENAELIGAQETFGHDFGMDSLGPEKFQRLCVIPLDRRDQFAHPDAGDELGYHHVF